MFGERYKETKRDFEDNTSNICVFRTRLSYSAYSFTLRIAAELTYEFKHRLRAIASEITKSDGNNSCKARYLAQELIRDFGTHYISGVVMGAEIAQDDYIDLKNSPEHI